MTGKKKVFIGIEIPTEVKRQLWGVSESLQKFGYPIDWVSQEKLHITLVYLGYLTEEHLGKVITILQETGPAFFTFTGKIGEIEAFPSIKHPRVIFVSLDAGSKETQNIYDNIASLLAKTGFKLEEQKFTPHVTLGRVKDNDFYLHKKIEEMLSRAKFPVFKSFQISTISLFESIKVGKEFIYKILLSVPLKG